MDKQEAVADGLLGLDDLKAPEAIAIFSAVLPSIATAIRIHGDCGIRIQLDIPDSDIDEVLKLVEWREGALEVTVRPVPK